MQAKFTQEDQIWTLHLQNRPRLYSPEVRSTQLRRRRSLLTLVPVSADDTFAALPRLVSHSSSR